MSEAKTPLSWRRATPDDLDAIMAIQDSVHSLLPEGRHIFADKMAHCGDGMRVLSLAGRVLGYGVAHPWKLDEVPPLDTPLGSLPIDADCLFIHDVALLPAARGQGASGLFVRQMAALARARRLPALALVSVYGTVPVWEKNGFSIRETVPARKLSGYGDTARYMVADQGAAPA